MQMTLALADKIVSEALATARKKNFMPIVIVALNDGGQIVVLKREDKTSLLRNEIAFAKAWGALGLGCGTRELQRRVMEMPVYGSAMGLIANGRFFSAPGGVLVRDHDGEIIGAIGVSGDIGQNDEICAVSGIEAAGMIADTGEFK